MRAKNEEAILRALKNDKKSGSNRYRSPERARQSLEKEAENYKPQAPSTHRHHRPRKTRIVCQPEADIVESNKYNIVHENALTELRRLI